MSFNNEQKERIRYHLGYLQVQPAAAIAFGQPVARQTLFLVESAMDRVIPQAETRILRILGVLDDIECKLVEGLEYLVASQLDSLTIREDHLDRLEREYWRWGGRLADILGVPFYPYANRFKSEGRGSKAGNIPVG